MHPKERAPGSIAIPDKFQLRKSAQQHERIGGIVPRVDGKIEATEDSFPLQIAEESKMVRKICVSHELPL